ncbi:MAG: outer membrane lipoprotein-sorting protein [Proteobacteria bacterium]|nr:outer membrane lipoprotein-sorting protein [Pseudomonadota bacterium]
MSRRRLALALRFTGAVAMLVAGSARAQQSDAVHDADHWISRIADALRIGETMTAHAHVDVNKPGREDDFNFDMQMLRDVEGRSTRTLLEMREAGDTKSIVTELVDTPGEPLTSWYWDLQKRRWIRIRGLQGTDPFADTTFGYEDLWFTEPTPRRKGTTKWVEEGGRRLIEIESEPYHYYLRVVTRIDPESGLPLSVRFVDNTGVLIREQHYEKITLVDGRAFPTVVRLRDIAGNSETTITFGDMRFGRRIPPSYFDLSAMSDRLRRGVDPVPEPPDLRDETPPAK